MNVYNDNENFTSSNIFNQNTNNINQIKDLKTQLDNKFRDGDGINLIWKTTMKFHKKKNLTEGKSYLTLTLYLNKFIVQFQIQEIDTFLKRENLSSEILKITISLLLDIYNKGNENFYKLLDLLLQSGVSAEIPIIIKWEENPIIPDISQKENITLLILGKMHNDIDLINIILKYNPYINQ